MAENSQAVIPDNLIIVDGEIGGVPSSSASDAGKVLAVDSNGDPSWVTPSGGTLYTEGNGIDISDQNVVSIDTTVVATKSDISGLQGELTAGTGIDITNDTISVDTSVIATKSEVPTVDTVYDASSTNAQAGTAVASAISTAVSGIEQVPSSSSADSGKVLTVDSNGDPSWVTPSGGTQYSAGNGINISAQNAISVDTTVVATQSDIGNVRQVPTSTSADEDKVLTVNSSGNAVWATAQGGSPSDSVFRAVYGSSTYAEVRAAFTAGKAICLVDGDEDDGVIASDVTFVDEDDKIIFSRGNALNTSNNIRVDYTLARNGTWSTTSVTPRQVPTVTSTDDGKVLTASYSGGTGSFAWATPSGGSGNVNEVFNWSTVTATDIGTCLTNGHNPIIQYDYSADKTQYAYLEAVEQTSSGTAYSFYTPVSGSAGNGEKVMTRFYLTTWGTKNANRGVRVSTPASSSTDSGKVLTVNSSGNPVWATAQGGTTYTAGNMISLANDAVAVSTTAGITDIQLVNALPASPVATVLYLIPET